MTDSADNVNTETNITSNVRPLQQKKEAKKSRAETNKSEDKTKKEKPPKAAELYDNIVEAINRTPLSNLPEPDFHLTIVQTNAQEFTSVRINADETCVRLDMEALAILIMNYVTKTLAHKDYKFTARQCRDCADQWIMRTSYNPDPFPDYVRSLNKPGLCWNRLPFDISSGPTPHFDELFSRMTNAPAVKAWIGSLFVPSSHREQYVWLHGEGNDGKSSLLNFLHKVFGDEGALSQSSAPGDDKHWSLSYLGKRLIFFPDFKDLRTLDTGPLKQLTGNDPVSVRPFYKKGYSARLNCKLIFASNHMPSIEYQKSNFRRIILSNVSPTIKFDGAYHELLWSEGGAFLHSCLVEYTRQCPRHEPIKNDLASTEAIEAWASNLEDVYTLWFEKYFYIDPEAEVTANELATRIQNDFRDFTAKNKLYAWLNRQGFKKTRKSIGNRPWIYKGLRIKVNLPVDLLLR